MVIIKHFFAQKLQIKQKQKTHTFLSFVISYFINKFAIISLSISKWQQFKIFDSKQLSPQFYKYIKKKNLFAKKTKFINKHKKKLIYLQII